MVDRVTLDRLLRQLLYPRLGHIPTRWPQQLYALVRRVAEARGQADDELLAELFSMPDSSILDSLVDAATVPHTALFRHPEQFDYLERMLRKYAAKSARPISIWCAGCATGEEAYSVAACAERTRVPVEILATDISPAAIRTAQIGRYTPRRVVRLPGACPNEEWFAPNSLRQMIRFETASIVGICPDLRQGPFDIIFCRNVLIYFDRASVPGILARLASYLHPTGAIVVSPADAVLPLPELLTRGLAVGWLCLKGEDGAVSVRTPVATPATVAPPPPPPPSPIENAARLLSAGDADAAEEVLTKLLNVDPDHLAGWFLLGEVLLQRGEAGQARTAFTRATKCSPHSSEGFDAETLCWAAARRIESLENGD